MILPMKSEIQNLQGTWFLRQEFIDPCLGQCGSEVASGSCVVNICSTVVGLEEHEVQEGIQDESTWR